MNSPDPFMERLVTEPAEQVVRVDIFGQRYTIRSALGSDYVRELAAYVTERMEAAAGTTLNSDVLRLAVLTALNITDELFRCRDAGRRRSAEVSERAAVIEQMLDQALG
jgi:cell division protein ZapA